MKVKILPNCRNWLVEIGRTYEVEEVTPFGVILKHPLKSIKPCLMKGEYLEVEI